MLVAGDGGAGVIDHAPYDRIIATCAVPSIPASWITQLRPGGLIVADLRGGLGSSLIVVRRDGLHESVTGRFLAEPGHFMWLRRDVANPLRNGGSFNTRIDQTDAVVGRTTVDPADLEDPDFRFLLQLLAPHIDRIWTSHRNDRPLLRMASMTGSWLDLEPDTSSTLQDGPVDLAQVVENAARGWHRHHRPGAGRLGITAGPTGTAFWVDSPAVPLPS